MLQITKKAILEYNQTMPTELKVLPRYFVCLSDVENRHRVFLMSMLGLRRFGVLCLRGKQNRGIGGHTGARTRILLFLTTRYELDVSIRKSQNFCSPFWKDFAKLSQPF